MRRGIVTLAAAAALLAAGPAHADPLGYGVSDDWPEWHPCGDPWWQAASDIGFTELRMTIKWDPAAPANIPFQAGLQAAVDCAELAGVRPILAVYPARPAAIGSNPAAQASFASFVGLVGQTFTHVDDFVIGNEPNQNRFWQPQYRNGVDAAAVDYEHTLARSYDALKTARPGALVWGPAISSRGNDNPRATSNPSHSPVWFLKDLGDAYRKSHRTRPIFDEFDMHPYPAVQDRDPFSRPLRWPQSGAADLNRIKQALWDAFHGTAQPIPAAAQSMRFDAVTAQPRRALPLNLDEVGEQTAVIGHGAAYDGTGENVLTLNESQQASNYVQLAEIAACDPDVASLLFFPLIDDSEISTGFQSGEIYADQTRKASYGALKSKIAAAQGLCEGGVAGVSDTWVPARGVIGAQAIFAGLDAVRSVAAAVTVEEDATFIATLQRLVGPSGPVLKRVAVVRGTAKAYRKPVIRFPGLKPAKGFYRLQIVVAAAVNPSRRSILHSRPFHLDASSPILSH